MSTRSALTAIILCLFSLAVPSTVSAVGGTRIIARAGREVVRHGDWPEGVEALVNHPLRTTAWNHWFSEWSNDVNNYGFKINSSDDLNDLIEKLAAIKSDYLAVRLSCQKPLNPVPLEEEFPDGPFTAVFSIGDQRQVDEWYQYVRKPFGDLEFTAAPVALKPTLTIYVQNDAVRLEDIKIPSGIHVNDDQVGGLFHRWNTTTDANRLKSHAERQKRRREKLDPTSLALQGAIDAFVEDRGTQSD